MKKTPVTIAILPQTEFHQAEKHWKSLEETIQNPPLVCTWDVVSTWIKHFEDIVSFSFIVGFRNEKVIGITLVTKETGRALPIPVNAYHLGTQGEPLKDWIHMINNNVLAADEDYTDFTHALAKTLMTSFTWEEFLIEDANPKLVQSILKATPDASLTVREITETCHFINLDSLRQENKTAMDHFSKDARYMIRRNMKELGTITVEDAKTTNEALDIFTELQLLHQESLRKKGRRGSYSSKRFTAFHSDLIKKLFPKGHMMFFRVRSERLGTLGCFYLMIDNGVAYGYSSGMNDFTDSELTTINVKRLKPGFVMHALCLQVCLDRGLREYNFSTGSEGYKKELTNETTTLITLKLQKSIKSKLREAFMEKYLKAEEQQQFRNVLKPLYKAYSLLF